MLIIIRHGQSEANAKGVAQGSKSDTGLTKQGKSEARRTAEFLKRKGIRVDRVFSSPIQRAMETAAPIARAFGCKIVQADELVETDKGKLSGLTGPEITKKYKSTPALAKMAARFDKMDKVDYCIAMPELLEFDKIQEPIFEIETSDHISARIDSFISKVPRDGVTVVVTHNGWIGTFMAHKFGTYFTGSCNLSKATSNCHISIAHFVGDRLILSLDRWNRHLDPVEK